MDNVYYDNVMHICVYEGRKMIYGHDITKDMFSDVIPDEFLKNAILSDMDFYGVGKVGFRYQAAYSGLYPFSDFGHIRSLWINDF